MSSDPSGTPAKALWLRLSPTTEHAWNHRAVLLKFTSHLHLLVDHSRERSLKHKASLEETRGSMEDQLESKIIGLPNVTATQGSRQFNEAQEACVL